MVLTTAALAALLMQCGGNVDPVTLKTIFSVESGFNPYVVANVTKETSHYFKNENEAIHFVNELASKGEKYSAGLGQIYVGNFKSYGLTNETAFDFCKNINVASQIFEKCYYRALESGKYPDEQDALRAAASCYYSNNFTRGFKKEKDGMSYVDRSNKAVNKIYAVPAMKPVTGSGDNEISTQSVTMRRGVVFQKPEENQVADINTETVKQTQPKAAWDVFNDFSK
ncbi:lytic transglycosylase domain-containing protein [Salmonella enterica]|nr:lytic transglycosylase domain-containing protein [Salmonella enterica]ECL1354311.1 lytic transglycosylase domain-containing protein [Salmonella enterica]